MHKHKTAVIICIAAFFAGIAIYQFTRFTFFGPFISGFCLALLILAIIGHRQANRAADLMDKKLKDYFNQQ